MIDPATLRDLWQAHASRLLLISRSIGEPAEDAVQEAFMALATREELPRDPLAWLVQVSRNRILQWRRSGERRRGRERIAADRRWFAHSDDLPENQLDADHAAAALNELPRESREIIVMHIWGDMSFETIAAVVGTSRPTAHRRYTRGLKQLQQRLEPDCQTAPATRRGRK